MYKKVFLVLSFVVLLAGTSSLLCAADAPAKSDPVVIDETVVQTDSDCGCETAPDACAPCAPCAPACAPCAQVNDCCNPCNSYWVTYGKKHHRRARLAYSYNNCCCDNSYYSYDSCCVSACNPCCYTYSSKGYSRHHCKRARYSCCY